jgi:hypothetical protein
MIGHRKKVASSTCTSWYLEDTLINNTAGAPKVHPILHTEHYKGCALPVFYSRLLGSNNNAQWLAPLRNKAVKYDLARGPTVLRSVGSVRTLLSPIPDGTTTLLNKPLQNLNAVIPKGFRNHVYREVIFNAMSRRL